MKTFSIPVAVALGLAFAPVAAQAAKPAKPKPVAAKPVAVEDPQPSAPALIAQARDADAKGQAELAERLAQSAIVAAPDQTAPYLALGDIYAKAGLRDYARTYYEAALALDPQLPAALKAIAALDKQPGTAQAAR